MSDDFPDNNSTSGIVRYGFPGINASIETLGDVDWFYYPNNSQPTAVVVSNAQFAITQIILRDQNGNPIATYYGPSANAHVNLQPSPPSTYYVSVTGFTADGQPATGTYTVSSTNLVDDYPNSIATTAQIVVDAPPLTGTADYIGDTDWFHITGGPPGEPVRVSLVSAEFDEAFLLAFDQYGNAVAHYVGSTGPDASFVAPPNAAYISIFGGDGAGNFATGSYSLSITSMPDDHGDSAATATPMVVDGPSVTAVNEGSDTDWFSFQGVAGVPLVFDFLTPPPAYAQYRVFDQYGRYLGFTNPIGDPSDYYPFTPSVTGTYYIEILPSPYTNQPTGSLDFQIVTATDDYPGTLPTNGVLTVDGAGVTGRHDFADDLDVFAINVAQPGDYRVEISPLSLFLINELLALYDSNGNLLDYRVAAIPGEGLTLHIDAPGTYYLGVESVDSLVNADLVYTLHAYSTSDDYGQNTATAGAITVGGGAVNGAINYNEDVDWLRFDATAGQVIRIEFNTSGFYVWDFQIMNDQGLIWTWFDDTLADNDVFYFQVTESGTYYFAVGDPIGARSFIGTGAYSVNMSVVPGVSPLPDPLTVGTPVHGEVVAAEGYTDALAFTATAGQTVRFDASADYFWRMSMYHYTPSGEFRWDIIEPGAFDRAIGFTFPETGTYYINFTGQGPGAYTLNSAVIADDAGSSAPCAAPLVLDGPAAIGTVNYENDLDWFAVTVDAGDVVRFNVTYDSSITALHWGLVGITDISTVAEGGFVHQFDQAGTYYFQVEGAFWEEVNGSYTVTATTYHDDYSNNTATTAHVTVGGPALAGQLDYGHDRDWVAVQLEAGENYIFSVTGLTTPGLELNGAINVFDQNGAALDGTGLSSGMTTEFIYTAPYSGTYYLDISGQIGFSSSPYTLTAAEFTPPLVQTISPGLPAVTADNFGHTHVGAPNVVNIYFAHGGDEFGAIVSDGWFAEEIDAVMNVLSTFEAYLNIDFQVTDFLPNADIVLTTFDDPNSVSIFQRPDWDVPIPVIGLSYTSPVWTEAALAPGGLGAAIVLNAMGYALGLSFPHAPEGSSYAMEGVTGPYDTGDFDLNQGVFTIMSFNDGWVTSPFGLSPSDAYGWQATPMALDIAALQAIYGANATANAGATTYTLGDANAAGAAWRSIWDTGGADTIAYSGARAATIDLRAATLAYQSGGAGHLSYVSGVYGGFTIANGVVIENATGGSGADTLIGNAAANTLRGGGGADVIDGGAGADTMIGGAGNDTYFVDNAGDVTSETSAGDGVDTVQSALTRTLGANLENLVLTGSAAINGFGNGLNNVITGNGAANQLNGFDGNDTLNGGAGADSMFGGNGDDAYIVDNAGDLTTEVSAAGGVDTVFSSVARNLTANIENLTLTGNAAITGAGNSLNNVIIGNAGANVLYGFGGNDSLDGGAGADTLFGAAGDDAYYVDDIGDITVEGIAGAAGGVDTVITSISRNLNANFENMTLVGAATIAYGNVLNNVLTGNGLANSLYGFDGADTLDGGAGADQMFGGNGDDTYIVDDASDVTSEASALGGTDTVLSSVTRNLTANLEILTLTGNDAIAGAGNALDNVITGNSAANTLFGLDGADTLDGGLSADTLQGGPGADTYVFSSTLGGGNVDAIVNFNVADDTIQLNSAVFTGLATGALDASALVIGSAAADADDRIIYDSATGALWFDADGDGAGAQVQFATLAAGLALTSADFIVGGP